MIPSICASCFGLVTNSAARWAGERNCRSAKIKTVTPKATSGKSSRRRATYVPIRPHHPALGGRERYVHRPPEGTASRALLLPLREAVRVLPSLVEHGVVVPPLHPRAHHDKSRPVDEVDGRDVLVRELLEPEVELLPLLWIGLPGGLLDQPVRFGILVPLGLGE